MAISKLKQFVVAPEEPAPDKVYSALVVRDVVVRTPCTTTIGGIPARSPEEARARAEEAALRLPEPPMAIDDETRSGWSLGEQFDPELGPIEVVEVFEEASTDREE